MKSRDLSYCILGASNQSDDPEDKGVLFTETQKVPINEGSSGANVFENEGSVDNTEYVNVSQLSHEAIAEYSRFCSEISLKSQQKLFVLAAWAIKEKLHLFKLYPTVLKIDATSHTNNQKQELLTVTIVLPTGEHVIILYLFLPNAKMATSWWVFHFVFQRLLRDENLVHTEVVVTDGDNQEMKEIKELIKAHLPHAMHIHCGFHIIVKGWATNCSGVKAIDSNH